MVYSDSLEPTWAATYSNSRILVTGDTENPELITAVQKIVDAGIASGRKGFVIYYPKDAKKHSIGEQIQDVKHYPNPRNYYVLEPKEPMNIDVPDSFSVEQITESILDQGYRNTDLVRMR